MKITEYRNAVSKSADNSMIDMEINHPIHGWIPYLWIDGDPEAMIDNDALRAAVGDNFAPYVEPVFTDEELARGARTHREAILMREVDPIVSNALRWAGMTEAERQAIQDYRQALLDVPQQEGFPRNINWPVKP